MLSILSISSIPSMHLFHPPCHVVGCCAAAAYEFPAQRFILCPQRQIALAQEVLVIKAQFFEAGARHVRQLQFHLL